MARTFTYDKRQHHRQQSPLRPTWRNTTEATTKRGKYADIADRVREHRLTITNRQTDQVADKAARQN